MAAPFAHGPVRWREVVIFSFMAYGLTWGWDAIWVVPKLGALLAAPTTPADGTAVFGNAIYHLPAMFGPLLAAVAMRLWVSREGLHASLGLRIAPRYYAVALIAPIAFMSVLAFVFLQTGLAKFATMAEPLTVIIVPLLLVALLLESVLGFGEEYGWRGYLLPRLMPLGEVPASLLLGIVWGVWHLPVVLAGVLIGGYPLWMVAPIHVAVVALASFPYTWLAQATGFSPAVAAVFHGSTNWAQQRLLTFLVFGNLLAGIAAIGAGWLIVILVVYASGGLLRRLAGGTIGPLR
jgi:hypothetical protein